MALHDDHDPIPIEPPITNGELSFMWMNVDGAANAWERMADYDIPTSQDCQFPCSNHTSTMSSYDDNHDCCFGVLDFAGPTFDLYARNESAFNLRMVGFEQDCIDDYFGFFNYNTATYVDCFVLGGPINFETGRDDDVAGFRAVFHPPDFAMKVVEDGDGEYDLTLS